MADSDTYFLSLFSFLVHNDKTPFIGDYLQPISCLYSTFWFKL